MSSLMRPSGPLPPRVYWVRRLLLLALVVLVIAVAWQFLGSRHGASPSSGASKPDASLTGVGAAQTSSAVPPPTAATSSSPPTQGSPHRARRGRGSTGAHTDKTGALPPSTGPCAPTDVAITVNAPDANVGQGTVATLALTTLDGSACTLQITPSSMVLRITSRDAVVWTSDDCPNLLPARQVVVRPDPATSYRWRWDGRKSVQGCVSPGAVATPGHYELEAALVGADSHNGYFDITR